MTYAKGTSVSPETTRNEIEKLLGRMGASKFGVMTDHDRNLACIFFCLRQRDYQLEIPLPSPELFADPALPSYRQPKGREIARNWDRLQDAGKAEWVQKQIAQATRERWRSVLLLLKAKIELIAIGIRTPEEEFMADIVTGNGMRLHAALVASKQMPPLLGAGPGKEGA